MNSPTCTATWITVPRSLSHGVGLHQWATVSKGESSPTHGRSTRKAGGRDGGVGDIVPDACANFPRGEAGVGSQHLSQLPWASAQGTSTVSRSWGWTAGHRETSRGIESWGKAGIKEAFPVTPKAGSLAKQQGCSRSVSWR